MRDELNLGHFFFSDDQIINKYQNHELLKSYQGGKHLRAKLLKHFGKIFDVNNDYLNILARVIELVHNATLTHDDVIDRSETRRSLPTPHEHIGNKRAVLLGDYILAKALNELSEIKAYYLFSEISLALKMLVDGEWMQYENVNPLDFSLIDYETLSTNKTGSLFSWCLIAPFSLINTNEEKITQLRVIGYDLGLIFQMKDDLLDFSPGLNKTPYLDFTNKNPSIVMSFLDAADIELETDIKTHHNFEKISDVSKKKFEVALEKAHGYLRQKHQRLEEKITHFTADLPLDQKYQVELMFEKLLTSIIDRDH